MSELFDKQVYVQKESLKKGDSHKLKVEKLTGD